MQVSEWRDSAGLPVVLRPATACPQRTQDPHGNPDNCENHPDGPQCGDSGREPGEKQNDSEDDHGVSDLAHVLIYYGVPCAPQGQLLRDWGTCACHELFFNAGSSEKRSKRANTGVLPIANARYTDRLLRLSPVLRASAEAVPSSADSVPPPLHVRRFLYGSDDAMQPVGRLGHAVRRLRPELKQCASSEMRSAQAVYHGTASCEGDAGIMSSPIPEREHGRRRRG